MQDERQVLSLELTRELWGVWECVCNAEGQQQKEGQSEMVDRERHWASFFES